jgi:hypothetical protein
MLERGTQVLFHSMVVPFDRSDHGERRIAGWFGWIWEAAYGASLPQIEGPHPGQQGRQDQHDHGFQTSTPFPSALIRAIVGFL